jgi:hypothetical protein
MSYLQSPRLHFSGEFIAEPSTLNNDPANITGPIADPGWNPNGDHRFGFFNAKVSALAEGAEVTTTGDPLIAGQVTTPGSPVAKIVDLDVDVQMASTVYGMNVSIADGQGNRVRGAMASASFRDFSGARLLGIFQSKLTSLQWTVTPTSWLAKLQAVSPTVLSIRLITDLFTGFSGPHKGRLAGTIGPASDAEPAHCATRRLVGLGGPSAFAALTGQTLVVDVGNVVSVNPDAGPTFVHASLIVGVRAQGPSDVDLKSGAVPRVAKRLPSDWRELGEVPTTLERYRLTGGVEPLALSAELAAAVESAPLGLFTAEGDLLATEAEDGLFVFPDPQVLRMNPGDLHTVVLRAWRFGHATMGVAVALEQTLNASNPGIQFPFTVTTQPDGTAVLPITAVDPGAPRGVIDGQVFGIGGTWVDDGGISIPGTNGSAVAIRVYSGLVPPASPKWADVQPIFAPYMKLYPAMQAILDLNDLETVKASKDDIRDRILRPLTDPGLMPVSRDLSEAKKQMLVAWIDAGCPE